MTARFALAATLLLLSACAGPGGGAGPELLGHTFLSTEVTGRTLVAGTGIELAFPERGRLTARAGCNSLSGEVRLDGGRLAVSGLGGTDMGCDAARQDQDAWLAAFLSAGPAFALHGDELVLTGGAEAITLVDGATARPDRPLRGTTWAVESLLDGRSAGSVPAGTAAFLRFDGDTVTGDDGCNRLGGRAVTGPGTIDFAGIVTTKQACVQPGAAALEAAVLATLEGQVAYGIDGDRLELRGAGGKGLQLRAADRPSPAAS